MKALKRIKKLVASSAAMTLLFTSISAVAGDVSFWTFRKQEKPLWDAINQENLIPGVEVKVKVLNPDDYESSLRSALNQQKGPDIFSTKAGATWLNPFLETGILVDMNTIGVNLSGLNGVTAVTGADGKVYAVPGSIQLQSVIYNEASLEELDREVPQTLSEFESLLQTAKDNGMVGLSVDGKDSWYLNQVMNEVVMAGFVSDATQEGLIDGTKCFTDSEVVSAFDRFLSWKQYINTNPLADDYGAMRTAVASGNAVAMVDGAWSTGPTSPVYEINKDFVPVFGPIPGANAKVVAHADGGYAANSQSKKTEDIAKVLKFTTTRKFAELFVDKVAEVPAYIGSYAVDNERVKNIVALLESAAKVEPFQAYSLNKDKPSYASLSAEAYQKMLAGEVDAKGAAAHIQKGLNSWGYVGAANCKM